MEVSMVTVEEGHIDEPKKKKTKKRKNSKIDDGVVAASSKKMNIKGIILSVTKPSYTLKRGIGGDLRSLRYEHRYRLRYLLRQLVRRQNWDEACGVLSVLLKGTHKETGLLNNNRTKYWATLELLEHMEAAKLGLKTVEKVYDIWAKKDAVAKNKRPLKGMLDLQLYFPLFCLSRGDTEKVCSMVTSLKQDFSEDPGANLVAGLAFSHLWHNAIQKEVRLHDSLLESVSPIQSVMSGPQEIMLTDHSNGQSAIKIQDSGSGFQPDSNTSIGFGKELVKQDRKVPKEEPHMSYDESDQNENSSRLLHNGDKIYGSIVNAHDVEDLLMPIKFPRLNYEDFISLQRSIQNDHYKAAVEHLQKALHPPLAFEAPPAFEALLPLIQILLFGDQVKEAIEEVESIVQNSHAALPFRLKASLLEHFSEVDTNKLSICFEDTLIKDPTCSHSLSKLISLNHAGDYSVERLVEMIALHLDGTYVSCDIWKEFASCFIQLSQCNDDTMSSCADIYGDSHTQLSKNIPDMFQDKNWRLRCRWWLTRHFTRTILASEVTSGNFELVAYKAAAACHLYGPEFAYVVTAYGYLKKETRQEISILKEHMKNAIGITRKYTRSSASSNV